MILAADRCRERSPNFYVADSLSEIEDILNPRVGDVALLVAGSDFQVWRLQDSESEADGLTVLNSNACEFKWIFSGSTLSVSIFGASPSNDDNAAAFAEAIGVAGDAGFPIFIPPGTYRHRSTINFNRHGLRVTGLGEVIFQAVGSFSPCISIDAGVGDFQYDIIVENFSIYGSGSANQTGLFKRNTPHGAVRDIRIKNVSLYGLHVQGDVLTSYEGVVLSDEHVPFGSVPTTGIRIEDSPDISFTTDCTFINCTVEKGSVYGWHLVKANNNTWLGGTSEGLITSGAKALRIDAVSTGNKFLNFFMEGNAGGDIDCYGNRNSFEDCVASSRPLPAVGIILRSGSYQNRFRGGYVYDVTVEAGALNSVFERVYVDNLISDAGVNSNFTEIIHCLQVGISATIFPGTRWVDWLRGRPIGGSAGIFWGIRHDVTDMLIENNTGHINLNAPVGSQVKPNRLTVPGATDLQEGVSLSAVTSPAAFTISQNDVNIGSGVSMLRVQSTIPINITGIVAPTRNGHLVVVHNVGANSIALVQEDPASAAANRFASPARVLAAQESTFIQYDLLSARWRILS